MLLNRERALEVMDRHELDVLVAVQPENVLYLSDYTSTIAYNFARWGMSAAILPRDPDRPPTLVVREMQLFNARHTWMPEMRVQRAHSYYVPEGAVLSPSEVQQQELAARYGVEGVTSFQRLLGQSLDELGFAAARVGCDDSRVTLELMERELSDAKFTEATNIFREIRVVKTPDEIKRMRRAAIANQTALESAANLVREGVSTGELVRHYRMLMNAYGGYGSHITGGGENHPWMHHDDWGYRLKSGDHVLLDPAGSYDYYWGDQARNVVIEPVPAKFEEVYGALAQCHEQVVPQLRPGASSHEIERLAHEAAAGTAAAPGLLPLVHSIGLEQYDQPQTLGEFFTEDLVFEPNMIVNFETLYPELGWPGMLVIEDTFLITETGSERLGTLPVAPIIR
jgi:Xaa-Pro dipeptidase